ncbi:hypothetical protein LCGC14_0499190 [marine sediment metagenome]|uniref:SprT-like domain-containing protein n=1 Tax=marine sediment metagenome TaxID=412755 RepID=A0A0F9S9H5_9ZZZZ
MSKVLQKIGTIRTTAERFGVPTEGIPTERHNTLVFVNHRLRSTLGSANWVGKFCWIEIHKLVFANPEQMRETLAHEIAHAMQGPGHGHSQRWEATAKSLGSKGKRHASREACEAIGIRDTYRVVAHCERCGSEFKRARAPDKRKQYTHIRCGGDIVLDSEYIEDNRKAANAG